MAPQRKPIVREIFHLHWCHVAHIMCGMNQHTIQSVLRGMPSIRAFATKTGLSRRTLLRLKNESPTDYTPTLGTLELVARALRNYKAVAPVLARMRRKESK